jgi:serine protease Do
MTFAHFRKAGMALVIAAAAGVGFISRGVTLGPARAMASDRSGPGEPAATTQPAKEQPAPPRLSPPDFAAIVRENGPAVVNVRITEKVQTGGEASPFGQLDPNDPFYQFFRRFQAPSPPRGEQMVRGLGSGFIVQADGVILTNAHVVDSATDVQVKLTDGREFKAKVVGVDKPTDIAVLKIDAKNLPVVRMGDSKGAQVGEWVLAIGSPFGLENSASAGIISAKARSLPNEGYVPFLQTDVAVNPGNSGGPLFDARGQVIGINSQIYTTSGGYQGLSFAIPIEVATRIENQLLAHGKVTRGFVGVTIQDLTPALASSFGLEKPQGALVSSVAPESPAAKAGVESGDVILKFDGREVKRSSDLPPMVSEAAPGARASLQVWRGGKSHDLTVTVGDSPGQKIASKAGSADQGKLGLAVRPLTPDERQQDGVQGGLVVENAAGPAARAGIQPGDVVLALNGTRVQSVEQLRGLLSHAGKQVAVLVQRGDQRIYLPVDLG